MRGRHPARTHSANKYMETTSVQLDSILRKSGEISISFQWKPQNTQAIILISYDGIRRGMG